MLTVPVIIGALVRTYKHWGVVPLPVVTNDHLLGAIKEVEQTVVSWSNSIRDNQDINKRDMDAMLMGTKAIATSMLDIKDIAKSYGKPPVVTEPKEIKVEKFVNELRYAERFTKTQTQRKALAGIINNVKETYGTGSRK